MQYRKQSRPLIVNNSLAYLPCIPVFDHFDYLLFICLLFCFVCLHSLASDLKSVMYVMLYITLIHSTLSYYVLSINSNSSICLAVKQGPTGEPGSPGRSGPKGAQVSFNCGMNKKLKLWN